MSKVKNWKEITKAKIFGAEIISVKNTTAIGTLSDEYDILVKITKPKSIVSEQQMFEYIEAMLLDLKGSRIRAGFKRLRDVEEITGISNAYLSQLESGKIDNPSYKLVRNLYCLYNGIEFPKNYPVKVTTKLVHCFQFQNKLNEPCDNCVICGKTKEQHKQNNHGKD